MQSKKQTAPYEAPSVEVWSISHLLQLLHNFSSEADVDEIQDGELIELN